jgi:hypothetical protein
MYPHEFPEELLFAMGNASDYLFKQVDDMLTTTTIVACSAAQGLCMAEHPGDFRSN